MQRTTPDEVGLGPGLGLELGLGTVAEAPTTPLPLECLLCYVWRMLGAFGCNATLRWALRWRDARAPRATGLEHRLARRGGFCDCEIFLNGWSLRSSLDPSGDEDGGRSRRTGLPCGGVRRGSSQPCALWVGRRPRGGR